jgi:hypothetical protein
VCVSRSSHARSTRGFPHPRRMSTENTLKRKSHKLQSNQTEAVFGAFVEETPALMGTGEILAPTATAATQESAVSAGTEAASDAAPTLEVIHMDDSIRATDEEYVFQRVCRYRGLRSLRV